MTKTLYIHAFVRWLEIHCPQVGAAPRRCRLQHPFTTCTIILTRAHPKLLRVCFRRGYEQRRFLKEHLEHKGRRSFGFRKPARSFRGERKLRFFLNGQFLIIFGRLPLQRCTIILTRAEAILKGAY